MNGISQAPNNDTAHSLERKYPPHSKIKCRLYESWRMRIFECAFSPGSMALS